MKIQSLGTALALGILLASGGAARAALNIYAEITLNGDNVTGEVSVSSYGGTDVSDDHVEVVALNHEVYLPPGSGVGGVSGRPVHAPLKMVKRVDKASPLLMRGLALSQTATAHFKFFRHNQTSGELEHHYSIYLTNARVSGVRTWSPSTLDPVSAAYQLMEEVSFVYQSLRVVDEITGAETIVDIQSQ